MPLHFKHQATRECKHSRQPFRKHSRARSVSAHANAQCQCQSKTSRNDVQTYHLQSCSLRWNYRKHRKSIETKVSWLLSIVVQCSDTVQATRIVRRVYSEYMRNLQCAKCKVQVYFLLRYDCSRHSMIENSVREGSILLTVTVLLLLCLRNHYKVLLSGSYQL